MTAEEESLQHTLQIISAGLWRSHWSGKRAMKRLGREDGLQLSGQADQLTVAEILATGAARDKLTEAPAWIVHGEALINVGLTSGRAAP